VYFNLPQPNPFQVPRFPQDAKRRYVPPPADFDAVAARSAGQIRAILLMALHTAARRGELFRLTWEDVDLAKETVRLGTRKRTGGGMEYDWLPLTKTLVAELAKLPRTGEFVFHKPSGRPYKGAPAFLRALCAEAGVLPFGFHGIRHLSASRMAEKGMPITGIQRILRHKSPQTTARYLHHLGVLQEELNRVFEDGRA